MPCAGATPRNRRPGCPGPWRGGRPVALRPRRFPRGSPESAAVIPTGLKGFGVARHARAGLNRHCAFGNALFGLVRPLSARGSRFSPVSHLLRCGVVFSLSPPPAQVALGRHHPTIGDGEPPGNPPNVPIRRVRGATFGLRNQTIVLGPSAGHRWAVRISGAIHHPCGVRDRDRYVRPPSWPPIRHSFSTRVALGGDIRALRCS